MPAPHSCPRCGYELTGEITRWVEACPLTGRCSECGTEFDWEYIFHADRLELPWLFEHGPGGLDLLRRWPATFVRVLRPRRFWSEVKTTHAVNVRRAVVWLALPCLVLHFLSSGLALLAVRIIRGSSLTGADYWGSLLFPITTFDWTYGGLQLDHGVHHPAYVTMLWVASVVCGLMFALLPWTRKLAKLRSAHIARAWVYSGWWILLIFSFRAIRNLVWTIQLARWSVSVKSVAPTLPWARSYPPNFVTLDRYWPFQIGAILCIWTLWWWWCAFHIGWRLHRATLLWTLLLVIAALAAIISVLNGQMLIKFV